ncbi:MAG: H-X9-DG-CTERM domain-containing protein [Pirellulales bacterium]
MYPRLSENPGPCARVNGGGWCRPASEFGLDGSSYDGATFPSPCAINCTNGEDIGTAAFPYPIYGSIGTSETFAFHPGGANILFGDASVHFLSEDIEIRTYAKMVTRKGHEVISEVLE